MGAGIVAGLDSDAVNGLLGSRGDRPRELEPVNLRVLSPLHRALLVMDGTVTTFLEAYTQEPMIIHRLAQQSYPLEQGHHWLAAPVGTAVLERQVLIEGAYSRQPFVYAASLVVPSRLPDEVQVRLQREGEGIGRVLGDTGVESRREVLWFGRDRASNLPASVRLRGRGDVVARAYRIIAGGQPVALIHESFPYNVDASPARD